MTAFEAQINGGKLKHVADVLRRVSDEAIFEITDQGITCCLVDAANAIMARITLPRAVFNHYDAEDMRIGVDLDRLGSLLKRATADNTITGDENVWYVTRGIHQKSMGLLEPARLRKAPRMPVINHTASMRFTGKEFKEIIAEASDISDHINIHASEAGLLINAISADKTPDTYKCILPSERFEMFEGNAASIYTLEYLQDIAKDIRVSDAVLLQFSSDIPCEIEYERDGVVVGFMLAPRIESD